MELDKIIQQAKQGKEAAYNKLFDHFAKSMFATSMRITNHIEDSKDIVQESFLHSFKKLHTLKDPNAYHFWLKRIVINNSLKSLKQRLVYIDVPEELLVETKPISWFKKVDFSDIRDEIQRLSPGARTVFSLFALEGYKHKEIAQELNISESTSKSQYRYACKQLRQKLSKYMEYEI